uniref:NADH dehydrogenase [ubiquinone] 1 alpha subcomplex subunit 12 n=1 Tax=Pelusios castaneus TaxID=367368 RepID=A0A8C8SXA2_9SAUR
MEVGAEYLRFIRRVLRQVRDHGGLREAMQHQLRIKNFKTGALIGVDKYGNKYYENKIYPFGQHRWVVYTAEMNGKSAGSEMYGTTVPPEWHRWLHSMTDESPTTHPPVARKFIQKNHKLNPTATPEQYVPYSTTRKKIQEWVPPTTASK